MADANVKLNVVAISEAYAEAEPWTTVFNDGATWTATVPTGTISLISNWDGSGQLSDTGGFANGWAGTAYYEKSADGNVSITLDISTVGTTTNATTIYVIPSGFRHGESITLRTIITSTGGSIAVGTLIVSSAGQFNIYNYVSGGTALKTIPMTYRARN